jgi:hypothetical protein
MDSRALRKCNGDLAPHFIALVPKRNINKHTVQEALYGHTWITSQGGFKVEAISEFFYLWDILSKIVLNLDVKDSQFICLAIIYFGPIFGEVCV